MARPILLVRYRRRLPPFRFKYRKASPHRKTVRGSCRGLPQPVAEMSQKSPVSGPFWDPSALNGLVNLFTRRRKKVQGSGLQFAGKSFIAYRGKWILKVR
jgi:hypothetical protein